MRDDVRFKDWRSGWWCSACRYQRDECDNFKFQLSYPFFHKSREVAVLTFFADIPIPPEQLRFRRGALSSALGSAPFPISRRPLRYRQAHLHPRYRIVPCRFRQRAVPPPSSSDGGGTTVGGCGAITAESSGGLYLAAS